MPAVTACPVSSGRCDERLECDHRAAVDVERVEAGAEVAHDVGQARRVEEREHLVILAPQLAQPLHRQRLGSDDQAALDVLGVQQPVHDQRGFDGLAQPDLVCEQPPYRHPRGRAFRHVQLMREQADAPAEEGPEAARLTCREQVQDVEPRQEVFGIVDVARRQPLEQRAIASTRLLRLGHERVVARREPERGPGLRKIDDQDPPFDRGDASGAELRIEAVSQVVPDGPRMHAARLLSPAVDGARCTVLAALHRSTLHVLAPARCRSRLPALSLTS